MDSQIEELKELVRRNIAVTEEVKREVHVMRKHARWSLIGRILIFLTVAGISSAFYFYYLYPYVQQIQEIYGDAKTWQEKASNFFSGQGQ